MNRGCRVAVKADVGRVPGLVEAGFDAFEVYVRDEAGFGELPPPGVDICAVHQPATVWHEGAYVPANLCDPGPLGERSAAVLEAAVAYAARCGATKVVVHPGYYDAFAVCREEAQRVLARRLDGLSHPSVTVCVENVTRWSNALFRREPALALLADFQLWLRLAPPRTSLVFDVEHFCLSTIVAELADDFTERFRLARDRSELESLERAVDAAFRARTSRDWAVLDAHVTRRVEEAVATLVPGLASIHVCGSDFVGFGVRDRRDGVGVYQGEHLPLGYQGLSGDRVVRDRIRHDRWVTALGGRRPPHIVLEVSERPEFDMVKELRRSRETLELVLGVEGAGAR